MSRAIQTMQKKGLLAFFLFAVLFACDWWLKARFDSVSCSTERSVELCGVVNEGFIFSLPFSWWLWGVAVVFFVLLLILALRSAPAPWGYGVWIALGLLCAGGVSNTVDRVLYTGVRDYIAVMQGVFNLADIFVLLGAFLLVTCTSTRKHSSTPS